jgi:hypothetical protein
LLGMKSARITQSGEATAKDLTADLKLTRHPRSLAATLLAFPSVSLFPQLGSLVTRIWIGQNSPTASCTACPPWREVLWSARRLRIAFRSTVFTPKSDARTRAHSKSPADCGTKHNGQRFAAAAKTFIDSGTDITNSASDSAFAPVEHNFAGVAGFHQLDRFLELCVGEAVRDDR